MTKYGFTGTREGMSDKQKCKFLEITKDATEFHHGDCLGADWEADTLIRLVKGVIVHIHPPDDDKLRAYCFKHGDNIWTPERYLVRNQFIVNYTEVLIAAPKSDEEEQRSGTWSTIRYARTLKRPIIILER